MSDGTQTKFIFCPRCGAIMYPPFCNICGYDIRAEQMAANEQNPVDGQIAPGGENPQFTPYAGQQAQPQPPVTPGFQAAEATRIQAQNINKKSRKKIWIPLVIGGTILIALLCLIGPVVKLINSKNQLNNIMAQNNKNNKNNPKTSAKPSSEKSSDEEEEGAFRRHFGRDDFDHDGLDMSFYENLADCYGVTESGAFDPFINKGVKSYRDQNEVFDSTHKNYFDQRSGLGPDYYEPFCDCVDEVTYSNQYTIHRDYYYYDDLMGATRVQANIAYARLEGNIPNLDKINNEIYCRTAADFLNYINGTSPYSQYAYSTVTFSVDSYITYNDGKKMSILLDAVVHTDDYSINLDSYIYAINIDLENGKIIENDEIINIDVDFAKEFRERCLTQNGRNSSLDPFTDEQVLEFLQDKESNIVFFTPLGLEVGMCYVSPDDVLNRGWMTITLKNGTYERLYLKDQSLTAKGSGVVDPNNTKYDDLKGTWIHINPKLALEEEEALKKQFPNYSWDKRPWEEPLTVDDSVSGNKLKGGQNTSEKTSEETSEEDSEEASEETSEETSEITSEPSSEPDTDIGDVRSRWLKESSKMQQYFDAIMGDGVTDITPDQYFKSPKERGKDIRP